MVSLEIISKHVTVLFGWLVGTFWAAGLLLADEPLPSWKDGPTRNALLAFVAQVTNKQGPDYVAPEARIAVFDNDGTLWSEKPVYFQLQFAIDRVKQLSERHPEWNHQQPFQAVLEEDMPTLLASGQKGLLQLVMASHAGMTTEEFSQSVRDWLGAARHPRFERPYSELVFQPMLELLQLLRTNGFQTYLVSGGGIEFMRVFAEDVYGVPPERVIGSSIKTQYELRTGQPVLVRLPELDFIDDKAGKPVAIQKFIGRRPIAAFGNSDGDLQMLQWTAAGEGPHFCLLVHHTDGAREWAYDRNSPVGTLDKALTEAKQRGWTMADMRTDWETVFAKKSIEASSP